MFKTEINIIYPQIIKQLQISWCWLIIYIQGSILKFHDKLQQSVEVLRVIIYKVWCKWNLPQWKENKFLINIQLSLSLTSNINMPYLYINSYWLGAIIFTKVVFLVPSSLQFFKFQVNAITLPTNSEL